MENFERIEWIKCNIKRNANAAVAEAIKDGVLVRPDKCERCQVECKPNGHHDNHINQLDVKWLCPKCHRQRDIELANARWNDPEYVARQEEKSNEAVRVYQEKW